MTSATTGWPGPVGPAAATDPLPPRVRRAAVVAAALLTAACAGSDGGTSGADAGAQPSTSAVTTPSPAPEPPPASATAAAGLPVTSGDSDYGPMLFDDGGQAIYLFDKEVGGRPDCYGDCAVAWPPVLTTGIPQATGSVRPELLGTVSRDDGSTQVTYAGHPLYFYAHEGPGQVLCHDVVGFGGTWLVVTPEGTPAA